MSGDVRRCQKVSGGARRCKEMSGCVRRSGCGAALACCLVFTRSRGTLPVAASNRGTAVTMRCQLSPPLSLSPSRTQFKFSLRDGDNTPAADIISTLNISNRADNKSKCPYSRNPNLCATNLVKGPLINFQGFFTTLKVVPELCFIFQFFPIFFQILLFPGF